jgi:hypothetical protein
MTKTKVDCGKCPVRRVCAVPKIEPEQPSDPRHLLMMPLITKPADILACPLVQVLYHYQMYEQTEVTP